MHMSMQGCESLSAVSHCFRSTFHTFQQLSTAMATIRFVVTAILVLAGASALATPPAGASLFLAWVAARGQLESPPTAAASRARGLWLTAARAQMLLGTSG